MSIYVYITRREKPFEDGVSISESDWRAVALADPTLREPTIGEIERGRPAHSVYFVWTAHPKGLDTWFVWTAGQIDVSNPDEPMVAKAMQLASKLDAHVISEMGEVFNEDGSHKGFVDGEPW